MEEFTASRAAGLVAAFDSSGIHRVGTPGDFASGEWLERAAGAAGAAVSRVPVAVNRTVVDEAYLECAGQRIDGLPMFDSPPTAAAAAGIAGTLGPNESSSAIGYLDLPPNSASIKHMRFEKIRRATRHSALVVATRVTGESLAPINAQYFDNPFGPPVLLVAGANHALLEAQAQNNTAAKVVSIHHREITQSYNVAAHIASGSSVAPLVVVTPRTGWWESTAERAGGIVGWLAAIAAAADMSKRSALKRDVRTYATCGHELGHLGLSELLTREAALVKGAHHWLHLGANLGSASLPMFLRAADPQDAQQMLGLLTAEGYPAAHIRVEPISAVSGEGRDITEHGGKVLSLAGSNAHFHAASDRWPGNVSAAGTAAIARAVAKWVALTCG